MSHTSGPPHFQPKGRKEGSRKRWILTDPTAMMNNRSSIKIILLSMATLSAAVMVKLFFFPTVLQFASSEVPRMYSSMLTWLTPPYLYFVVNCIIITIAATSHFQTDDKLSSMSPSSNGSDQFKATQLGGLNVPLLRLPEKLNLAEEGKLAPEDYGLSEPFGEVIMVTENMKKKKKEEEEEEEKGEIDEKEEEDDFVVSRSNWMPPRRTNSGEISSFAYEKPPVSSKFGIRRTLKASPEGKLLGVARAKRNETLESMWKMITDGRAMPLTRHLKKSDTWGETTTQREKTGPETSPMKKSEIFNDRSRRRATNTVDGTASAVASPGSSSSGGGGGRLRREASPSQDELNRRVEAFINKFNQEMRLQRQQSEQHYWNMLNNNNNSNKSVTLATKQ